MYKIEQNIPVPTRATGNGLRALMRSLYGAKVGASVFIPKSDYATGSIRGSIQAIGPLWAQTMKVTEGGVEGTRVWKIADLQFPTARGVERKK